MLRDCVKRKILLTPYLLQEALVGHRDGTPLMRPMFLEFPDDLNTYPLDTQYMFGSNLLVAPVFAEDGSVTFYVPRTPEDAHGKWISWFDHGKTYESGQWYTETHGFDTLPILVRPGSVTPLNPVLKAPQEDALIGLEVLVNGTLAGEVVVEVVDPSQTHEVLKTVKIGLKDDVVVADDEAVKVVRVGV